MPRRFRVRFRLGLAVLAALVFTHPLQGQEDEWFGADKLKHLGASAVMSAGGTALGGVLFESDEAALTFGAALTLSTGAIKEWSDSRGNGSASWRDMAWNLIGTTIGSGIVYLVQRARSGRDQEESFGCSRVLPHRAFGYRNFLCGGVGGKAAQCQG